MNRYAKRKVVQCRPMRVLGIELVVMGSDMATAWMGRRMFRQINRSLIRRVVDASRYCLVVRVIEEGEL